MMMKRDNPHIRLLHQMLHNHQPIIIDIKLMQLVLLLLQITNNSNPNKTQLVIEEDKLLMQEVDFKHSQVKAYVLVEDIDQCTFVLLISYMLL